MEKSVYHNIYGEEYSPVKKRGCIGVLKYKEFSCEKQTGNTVVLVIESNGETKELVRALFQGNVKKVLVVKCKTPQRAFNVACFIGEYFADVYFDQQPINIITCGFTWYVVFQLINYCDSKLGKVTIFDPLDPSAFQDRLDWMEQGREHVLESDSSEDEFDGEVEFKFGNFNLDTVSERMGKSEFVLTSHEKVTRNMKIAVTQHGSNYFGTNKLFVLAYLKNLF